MRESPDLQRPVYAIDGTAGVDEAGRGPLAGPVVAAAVILDSGDLPSGIDDSKKLSEARRDALALEIRERAAAFQIVALPAAEIDALNILQATLMAMRLALQGLPGLPERILIDGNRAPLLEGRLAEVPLQTLIGGDGAHVSIGAASILAKTYRDALMCEYDRRWPQYGFASHKGYPTAAHRKALLEHGACEIHRASFAPVRDVIRSRAGGTF